VTDLQEELAKSREGADAMVQRLERVNGRLEPVRGEDGTGQVVVALDPDGDVRSVAVGFSWEQHLGAGQLGAAVLEAYTAALVTRFEKWSEAYRDTEEEPLPRARPSRSGADLVAAFRERIGSGTDTAREAGQVVEEVLQDVLAGLEEANRLLDDHATRRHAGRSPGGHVSAYVTGTAQLSSVEFDVSWAAGAHPANLGREATQAIQAATRTARRDGFQASLQATRLARVARAVTDPHSAHTLLRGNQP
jgi:hypothetical protein